MSKSQWLKIAKAYYLFVRLVAAGQPARPGAVGGVALDHFVFAQGSGLAGLPPAGTAWLQWYGAGSMGLCSSSAGRPLSYARTPRAKAHLTAYPTSRM